MKHIFLFSAIEELTRLYQTNRNNELWSKLLDFRNQVSPIWREYWQRLYDGLCPDSDSAKAILKKEKDLLVNVGASIVLGKSVAQTKKLIEKQREEVSSLREIMMKNIKKLVTRAAQIESELQEN